MSWFMMALIEDAWFRCSVGLCHLSYAILLSAPLLIDHHYSVTQFASCASINFIIRSSLCSFLAQICCRRFSLSRPLGGFLQNVSLHCNEDPNGRTYLVRIKFGLRTHLLCRIAFLQEEILGSFPQVWDEQRCLFSVLFISHLYYKLTQVRSPTETNVVPWYHPNLLPMSCADRTIWSRAWQLGLPVQAPHVLGLGISWNSTEATSKCHKKQKCREDWQISLDFSTGRKILQQCHTCCCSWAFTLSARILAWVIAFLLEAQDWKAETSQGPHQLLHAPEKGCQFRLWESLYHRNIQKLQASGHLLPLLLSLCLQHL